MSKLFIVKNHAQNVLEHVLESLGFDVTLIAGDTEPLKIPAHRLVLSASADYFKTMFATPYLESTAREVKLPGVDGETLKSLVEFCYSGRLQIREDNVEKLIVAADSLLLDEVFNACTIYLTQKLDKSNCLHIFQLAERHNFVSLLKSAKDYCLMKFLEVCEMEPDKFLGLNVDLLGQLLASDYLFKNDFYCMYDLDQTEEYVFENIMEWLEHDPLIREEHKDELLKLVRMPLLKPSFVINRVQPVCTSFVSQQMVAKAMEWHSLPLSRKLNINLVKPRKRINQVLIAITGDTRLQILYRNDIDEGDEDYSWMEWSGKLGNRCLFDTAIVDDDLFMVGDCNDVQLNTVICLNLLTMTLRNVKSMHNCRSHVSMAALKGFLYAVGGHDGENCLNTVEKYDKETDTWSEVAAMLDSRKECSTAILNEKLYVVGGFNNSRFLDLAECYDPQLNVWTKIASVSEEACYRASVTVASGILYLVGGRNYKVMQKYEPKTDKWVKLGRLSGKNLKNKDVLICTFEDKVMLFDEDNFVEYDPIENIWKKKDYTYKIKNISSIFSYSGELKDFDEHWNEKTKTVYKYGYDSDDCNNCNCNNDYEYVLT